MYKFLRKGVALSASLTTALLLAACGGGGSNNGGATELTLWHNYGTQSNAKATDDLVAAFEKVNPDIKIKVESQPQDNFFPLLKSAAISQKGPDIAVMWNGLYAAKYNSILANLKGLVPDASLQGVKDLKYTAPGFDPKNGVYVLPTDTQFYIGYYNKKLMKAAGLADAPQTWDQLFDACAKLRSTGVTPIAYGNGGGAGATFVPWFDLNYLAAGVLKPDQLRGLYDGSIPWTSPDMVSQLSKWGELSSRGCINSDPLTSSNNFSDFQSGKAAMVIDGSWDLKQFHDSLGNDLGTFLPPFSDSPMNSVVEFAGSGYAITKASTHKEAAAKFLAFVNTPEASKILSDNGLIPNIEGFKPGDPLSQAMVDYAATSGDTRYPMIDNVIQPEVVDAGLKGLPSVLADKTDAQAALESMQAALMGLPASDRQ